MRITDIVSKYSKPDSIVVDTSQGNVLTPYLMLPPNFQVTVLSSEKASTEVLANPNTILACIAQELTGSDLESAQRIIVLVHDSSELFGEYGRLFPASRGWEVSSIHLSNHSQLRIAIVLTRSKTEPHRLAESNEFNIMRFIWRLNAPANGTIREQKTRLASLAAENSFLQTRDRQLTDLIAAHTRLRQTQNNTELALRNQKVQNQQLRQLLDKAYRRLEKSRKSVSFKLGRATTVSLRDLRKNKLKTASGWLQTFRGPDEILVDTERSRHLKNFPHQSDESSNGVHAVAKENLLLGSTRRTGTGPVIAGIASQRMESHFAASTTYLGLTPNTWLYLLEEENPDFLLICSDGLEPGTAWGSFGVPDGRDASSVLRELAKQCNERQIPLVYWDTKGTYRQRLGAPRGCTFDAIYSVNPEHAGTKIDENEFAVQLLEPAVALSLFNPVARMPRGIDTKTEKENSSAPAFHMLLAKDRSNHYRAATEVFFGQTGHDQYYQSWHMLEVVSCGASAKLAETETDSQLAEYISLSNDLDSKDTHGRIAYLSNKYGIHNRLNHIARNLNTRPVSKSNTEIGMLVTIESANDLQRLKHMLASIEAGPSELHVIATPDFVGDCWTEIEEPDGPALYVYSSRQAKLSTESTASYFIALELSYDIQPNLFSLFSGAIGVTNAEILALQSEYNPELPTLRYGDTGDPKSILALSRNWIDNQDSTSLSQLRAIIQLQLYSGKISQMLVQAGPHQNKTSNIRKN